MSDDPKPTQVQLTSMETCRRKHMYHSLKTAKRAKHRRNKTAGINYLRVYQCNVCDFWHLTTEKKVDD
ncbi:hypothetical protein RhoFasB10_03273 [Rhodococcus sp. B10]|nr:hypothetical protein [Rhodococcus sp. B10]